MKDINEVEENPCFQIFSLFHLKTCVNIQNKKTKCTSFVFVN